MLIEEREAIQKLVQEIVVFREDLGELNKTLTQIGKRAAELYIEFNEKLNGD